MKTLRKLKAAIETVPTAKAAWFTLAFVAVCLLGVIAYAVYVYVMIRL